MNSDVVRFGRLMRMRTVRIVGTIGVAQFIPSSPQRVAIYFDAKDLGERLAIGFVQDGTTFYIPDVFNNTRHIGFNCLEHGELPTLRWQVDDPDGLAQILLVTQLFMPEDELNRPLSNYGIS